MCTKVPDAGTVTLMIMMHLRDQATRRPLLVGVFRLQLRDISVDIHHNYTSESVIVCQCYLLSCAPGTDGSDFLIHHLTLEESVRCSDLH